MIPIKYHDTTHTTLMDAFMSLTAEFKLLKTLPENCELLNGYTSLTRNLALYISRLSFLIAADEYLRLDEPINTAPAMINIGLSNSILNTIPEIILYLQDNSKFKNYLNYVEAGNSTKVITRPVPKDLESISIFIEKYTAMFTEIQHQLIKSDHYFKRSLDLLNEGFSLQHQGFFGIINGLIKEQIANFQAQNIIDLDSHYYLDLLILLEFPSASDTLKVPHFTKNQVAQLKGYLSEHVNLLYFLYGAGFKSETSIPFAYLPISSVINKNKDHFFNKPISKNRYSLLINYLTSVTQALLTATNARLINALEQRYTSLPILDPFVNPEPTLSPTTEDQHEQDLKKRLPYAMMHTVSALLKSVGNPKAQYFVKTNEKKK